LSLQGVSSGIGRDALRLLHHKGYHIYGSVRKEADAKSLTEAYPKGFTPLIFDVQDQEAVNQSSEDCF
jgi:NADP-dependent 3-hydroxy acid dehydrogenase YdfG